MLNILCQSWNQQGCAKSNPYKYNEKVFSKNSFVALSPLRNNNHAYLFLRCHAGVREWGKWTDVAGTLLCETSWGSSATGWSVVGIGGCHVARRCFCVGCQHFLWSGTHLSGESFQTPPFFGVYRSVYGRDYRKESAQRFLCVYVSDAPLVTG